MVHLHFLCCYGNCRNFQCWCVGDWRSGHCGCWPSAQGSSFLEKCKRFLSACINCILHSIILWFLFFEINLWFTQPLTMKYTVIKTYIIVHVNFSLFCNCFYRTFNKDKLQKLKDFFFLSENFVLHVLCKFIFGSLMKKAFMLSIILCNLVWRTTNECKFSRTCIDSHSLSFKDLQLEDFNSF